MKARTSWSETILMLAEQAGLFLKRNDQIEFSLFLVLCFELGD